MSFSRYYRLILRYNGLLLQKSREKKATKKKMTEERRSQIYVLFLHLSDKKLLIREGLVSGLGKVRNVEEIKKSRVDRKIANGKKQNESLKDQNCSEC